MAHRAAARNFQVHVSRNFITGNFQATVSLLNSSAWLAGGCPYTFRISKEVSEVGGGAAAGASGPCSSRP